MAHQVGLKNLRSPGGVVEPNKYWRRNARPKCKGCSLTVRGPHHATFCKGRK